MAKLFISHISEDAEVAARLKAAIRHDFLELVEAFVSSDGESIRAGEPWLISLGAGLRQADMLLILCSEQSVQRPWVNFEAGAAWMIEKPIVPVCYKGMKPSQLPMPLSTRQGVSLESAEGRRRLHVRIAEAAGVPRVPECSFRDPAESNGTDVVAVGAAASHSDPQVWKLIHSALSDHEFKWRSIERLASVAGVSEEEATKAIRDHSGEVRMSRGKGGSTIAGLRSRVGD